MDQKPDLVVLRKNLKWTQGQMAEYLGLDRSSVSRMERGQKPKGPTKRLLDRLASPETPAPSTTEALIS